MNADESTGKMIFHPERSVPVRVTRLDHEPDGYVRLQLARQNREDLKDKYGWSLEPVRLPSGIEVREIIPECGTCRGTGWYAEPTRRFKRPCATCLRSESPGNIDTAP